MLQPQDGIGEEATRHAEQEHSQGVLLPIVLSVGIHPKHSISEPFNRLKPPIEPGASVGIEHLRQVEAHGFRNSGQR